MTEWEQDIDRIVKTDKPILVGPFRQEFGFELLYWLPFLQWIRETWKIPPERLIVATRGGAGVYYGVPSGVELYRLRNLKEIREANIFDFQRRGTLKPQELTPFDHELLRGAEYDLRHEFEVLHPGLMFRAFAGAWHEEAPSGQMFARLKYPKKLPLPPLPEGLVLPEQPYTAVRFYSRATFPHTGVVQHWATRLVERLASRGPVVVLEPPDIADDHVPFRVAEREHVLHVRDAITLDDSLAIQGAIIGRAARFIGTYGGMQQLALLLGIPSVGYYTEFRGTLPIHLEVSLRVARAFARPFLVLRAEADEKLLRDVL